MKKYFLVALMGIFSVGTIVSCSDRNDDVYVENTDTYPVVLDINNVNFVNTPQDGYNISRSFTKPLVDTDVVLIYRKAGNATDGSTVYQSIPRTLFVGDGKELDYDFDFTKNDIMIYANGNYDISTTPQFLNAQSFRVVLVPASMGGKNANIDYSNYESVIKFFKIDETKIKSL